MQIEGFAFDKLMKSQEQLTIYLLHQGVRALENLLNFQDVSLNFELFCSSLRPRFRQVHKMQKFSALILSKTEHFKLHLNYIPPVAYAGFSKGG